MWSSRTFIPPPPFSCGARVPGTEAELEYWVTRATIAGTADTSTANGPLFANSGFGGQQARSRLGGRLEPRDGLRHAGLELVGVLGTAAQRQRREDLAHPGDPLR